MKFLYIKRRIMLLFIKDLWIFTDNINRSVERTKAMVIDKIGNINNITEPKSTKSVSKAKETKKADSIQISSEAKIAAENARYVQIVKDTPDIRMEKVKDIKARIQDGSYNNFSDDKILEMVAEKIANRLLRK